MATSVTLRMFLRLGSCMMAASSVALAAISMWKISEQCCLYGESQTSRGLWSEIAMYLVTMTPEAKIVSLAQLIIGHADKISHTGLKKHLLQKSVVYAGCKVFVVVWGAKSCICEGCSHLMRAVIFAEIL